MYLSPCPVIGVFGDENFKTPDDYLGEFYYRTAVINHVKGSVAWDPSTNPSKVTTISVGGSNQIWGISTGASNYWYANDILGDAIDKLDFLKSACENDFEELKNSIGN